MALEGRLPKDQLPLAHRMSMGSALTGCTNVTFPPPCRDCTMLDEKA
jgi:hypothetical protein